MWAAAPTGAASQFGDAAARQRMGGIIPRAAQERAAAKWDGRWEAFTGPRGQGTIVATAAGGVRTPREGGGPGNAARRRSPPTASSPLPGGFRTPGPAQQEARRSGPTP